MKKAILLAGLSLFLAGCSLSVTQEVNPTPTPEIQTPDTKKENTNMKQYNNPPTMAIDKNKTYIVSMETSKGTMVFELFAKATP